MKLYHDYIGFSHLISAIVALITGSMVLLDRKGTKRHQIVGYIYFISMLILNITAFMIYRLFGGFGIFHFAAIISLVTVTSGILSVLLKPNNWLFLHFSWMYWSVMGLYAAFASEVLTRIPESPFFGMVGIATGLIMLTASIIYNRKKSSWKNKLKNKY
ncbi:MAG: DUF2306 domain-containing protein [Fulvivirga sp.]|nr:DUF2306 domain-containing protein [Fulvivirga sp.]